MSTLHQILYGICSFRPQKLEQKVFPDLWKQSLPSFKEHVLKAILPFKQLQVIGQADERKGQGIGRSD